MSRLPYYRQTIQEVFEALHTEAEGLSDKTVRQKRSEFGLNRIESKKRIPAWIMFLSQFKDVMIVLLLIAAGLSFVIGSYNDAYIMLLIVLINGIIGYVQEFKSEKIMASLKTLIQSPAKVFRENQLVTVPQHELVPGDIVQIEEGDKVPADIRIIEAFNLKINEFSLTGESLPQEKHNQKIEEERVLSDQENMAFLGTTVSTGSGKGIVVAIGMETEVGKIAGLTQKEKQSKSPLQMEMRVIARRISLFAAVIGLFIFAVSLWKGFPHEFALIYALGVAVAVVPQALPMQITVALSNGMARLAKKNAVVKKLTAVETLGSTNVLATDKTGTITKNEMTVRAIWFDNRQFEVTGTGYEPSGTITYQGEPIGREQIDAMELMLDAATMASNAEIQEPDSEHSHWYPVGDPTEAALVTLSRKAGTHSPSEDEENPELHEFSFDSYRKRMSSVRSFGDKNMLCMKGSVDSLLGITKSIYRDGRAIPLEKAHRKRIDQINEAYSKNAMRVLAFAYRELDKDLNDYSIDTMEKDVTFLGLMAMIDPPKEGVKEAIHQTHGAKIKTFIMTGDHATTAKAIGEEIQLGEGGEEVHVITGKELGRIDDSALIRSMRERQSLIFSRVSPEDKLRIVRNLIRDDAIVAVTGDGVNDAPALKSAHIGIAMGSRGTDVAKEAADLVILDDNYSTIVHAIREGRTIYQNLKKTIISSLTSNIGELSIVLLGLLAVAVFGWDIPILAIQILAIDLLAEILPLTALTFDGASEGLMGVRPRKIDEHMLNRRAIGEILVFGLLMGALAFFNYAFLLLRNDAAGSIKLTMPLLYQRATTISYVTIVACQYVNILSRRYETVSLFDRNLLSNGKLMGSIVLSSLFVVAAIHLPFLNHPLRFQPLAAADWVFVGLAAALFLLAHEVLKARKRNGRASVS